MKLIFGATHVVGIELTERNLESLLNKLRYNQTHPEEHPSYCTIAAPEGFFVKAVDNEAHYADRSAGPMLDNATGEIV